MISFYKKDRASSQFINLMYCTDISLKWWEKLSDTFIDKKDRINITRNIDQNFVAQFSIMSADAARDCINSLIRYKTWRTLVGNMICYEIMK